MESRLKSREALRDRIQSRYVHLVDYLKEDDVNSILDRLFEKRIFGRDLVDEIRSRRTRHDKAIGLIDNIMCTGEENMLYFLELIQFVMPILYEEITGKRARRSLVDDAVFSNITRQSSIIRHSLRTLENIWRSNYTMNRNDFDELKKGLLHAEKQIEKMWNAVTTTSDEDDTWKSKYDELNEKYEQSENEWKEKCINLTEENNRLKEALESKSANQIDETGSTQIDNNIYINHLCIDDDDEASLNNHVAEDSSEAKNGYNILKYPHDENEYKATTENESNKDETNRTSNVYSYLYNDENEYASLQYQVANECMKTNNELPHQSSSLKIAKRRIKLAK